MKSSKKSDASQNFSAESPDLIAKLKSSNPDVQYYISALKTIITNLQHQNLKLEAQNVSLYSRVKILEKEKADGKWIQIRFTSAKKSRIDKPPKNDIDNNNAA